MRLLVAGLLFAYGQAALAGQHTIPLFVPSSDLNKPPGVLRIINHDAESGSVEISAIDDAGVRSGPVTVMLDSKAAVELDATDLEMGNPAKGLSAGLGGGVGDWRLEIDSDLDIEPLAYVRTADGFVASMHDLVREENMRYAVPVFNTGANVSGLSRLRLINPGGEAAEVSITAVDDAGAASSGGGVSLTLLAGGARTLTAGQLEAGGNGLNGGLGTGTGKWRLVVTADRPILVMNLLANTSGRLGNLSTSSLRDNAPGSHAAFGARFAGMMLAYRVDGETATLEVLEGGRFTETAEVGGISSTYAGGYGYERTGLNAGRLTLTYDDGDECLNNVYFTSTTAGWFTSSCTDIATASGSWSTIESSVALPSFAAATIADQSYTVGTAIGALTLPEASGGKGTLSYSLSPSIPGLAFSAATRQLTGTPTAAGTHAMTYGVTDSDGDSDTLSFSITVEDSDGGTPGPNEGDCHVGLLVSPGGSCTYPGTSDAFSVDQDGRASFLVISSVRAINVNSLTFMGQFYDFRASHQGDGVWRIDRLEGSTTPTTGGGTGTSPTFPAMGGPGDQTYTLDTAITALTLPAASGGDGTLTYSLSPDVPGLSFDPMTRQLTGTPTTEGSFAMTYTITDADGDSDSISFTITVEESDDGGNDKAALMALYNATDGANWSRSDNWGTNAPLDQWHGVTVDTNGRVIRLELPENQLSGPIPAELGDLANLEWLDLGRNALTGSIPPELAKLTNLETLDLAYGENALSGSIPPELGNLTNLTWLRLAGNTLSGSIPPELGQLGNLQRLDLDYNELSGSVPSWLGNLTNLHALDLAGNQLSGSIPPELGELTNLRSWLLLSDNQLSGPIPAELGDLANLERLYLSDNQLSGPIPAELGDLANLELLWLDGNELSGPIPAELGDLANLQWLLVSGNQLSGCIPDGLRDVPTSDLSELGLTFCGDGTMGGETSYGVGETIATLPTGSWFPDVTSGGSFSLSGGNAVVRLNNGGYIEEGDYRYTCESAGGCQITNGTVESGTIVETSMATMPEDTQPSFAGGSGPGNQTYTVGTAIDTLTLPAATGGDGTLTYSLSPNVPGLTFNATTRQLAGTPTAAGSHAMTYTATDEDGDTDRLSFTVTVEESNDGGNDKAVLMALYNATDGANWSRSDNWGTNAPLDQWHGVTVDTNGRVIRLNLGENELSGPIPAELGGLANLEGLWLYGNQLSGPIPAELGGLANLEGLWLYGNQLSGPIPAEFGGLANLTVLGLSQNELSGPIPAELGGLANLRSLVLSGNELSGPIPGELGGLANLTSLSLWGNELSGPIPAELGDLANLTSLRLYRNQLSGPIPAELGGLANLTALGLSQNELSGPIPAELGGLANLESLDLYENELSGPIPAELAGLANLELLWLSGNELSGPIPAELGGLANLRFLYLDHNELSGPIPAELGGLANLRFLYLDHNELSGPIPAELGGLANLTSLRLYGNELSGPIPAELGDLANLTSLRLYRNQLSGPIPAELGGLANLTALGLSQNELSGPIPAELGDLANLEELYLSGNQLSGCIPDGLRDVPTNDLSALGLTFCGDGTMGGETSYGVGDTITTLPTGSWFPDVTSGGSFSLSGGNAVVRLNNGGYIEEGDYRYTCESAGGCQITNGTVESGTIVETSMATMPEDTQPSFAGGSGPGNQTYTVGTAIDTLTLPAATGGDGTLTYSLSPNVPGLTFNATTRQLAGTPTAAGSHAMTYTATDEDGDTDRLSFTVTVEESNDGGNDKAVLMALYNATDGANWSRSDNWGTNAPLDQWHGVTVDTNGRVIRLNLGENELSGPIPAELGGLANLEGLWLYGNQLSGPIPAELGGLANLEGLWLYGNQLSGPIPAEFGGLANLTVLGLSQNELSGPIPAELGGLANLRSLVLSGNELSGPIPGELGGLANLTSLSLWGNELSGPIPAELGDLANLTSLRLYRNQLSGPIPAELGGLANLTALGLSQNELSGPIPAELGGLANLESLDLYENELSGPIPAELAGLANLELLGLSGNELSGPIPAELAGLANLELLWLSGNELSGPIPAELGGLANLRFLYLDHNELSGPIPAELGGLANLRFLYLDHNELSGPIPAELGGLANLTSLRLYGNELSGPIPAELGDLANLTSLRLYRNQLSGPIPAELGGLANLTALGLSQNELSGPIPAELGDLANLEELYLSGNQLSGCIPDGLRDVPTNDLSALGLTFCGDGTMGGETSYGVGDTITTLPTGSWFPDVTSGGSFSLSGGNAVVRLNNGGYIEEGDYRYTCESAGGCQITNGTVESGTIVETSTATMPEDTQPSFAGGSGPGNQTYTVGTAIDTLTLPAASGGEGTLTYSLSPGVPGLTFNAATRQLTGTPTAAGTHAMTYTVTDGDGDTDTLGFTITVQEADSSSPDLVVESTSVSNNSPEPGASITISATVRNQGAGESAATTLRYYRSADATITTGDTEVGTGAVSALAASTGSDESISLTAPSAAGTYYYGACVDLVSGESDTGNNCSTAVRVTVGGGNVPGGFDWQLDDGNGAPADIIYVNGRFYVADRGEKVYAYTASGERDAAADFDLDPDNSHPDGLTFANGRFYVAQRGDQKVYAYTASGERDAAADFDLHADNSSPRGIVFANDRFYVLDWFVDKVYAYSESGEHDAVADFDLHADNKFPWAITYANGRFYVVDLGDRKVYAYTESGERDAAADFRLHEDNFSPEGITYTDGWFYVLDIGFNKVFAYPGPGSQVGGETSYGVGDTIATLPTGSWFPDVTTGGSFSLSGGNAVVRLNNGGYIEEGDYRYTCQNAGGCQITNGTVESGTIVETSTATMPEDTQPSFAGGSGPGNQSYTVGTVIDALTLPAATGGDGTLTYSLSPGVPGLTFNAATRQLTGTPTAAGTHAMTYTVTDGDGDSDTLDFTITIEAMGDSEPSFGTTTIADQAYTAGTAIDALTLPAASGGNGTLSYSLSPNVPGLAFDAATRQLTGTPTAAGTHAMTYTVTDGDGDSDTLSFGITVEESDGGTPGANEGDCQVGQLVSPGGSCTYPGTTDAFGVDQDGRASFLVISSVRAINVNSLTFMGQFYDFRASHQGDGVWRIDRLEGSTTPTTGGGTDTSPTFPAMGGPGDQTYALDTAITALTLPAATGGDGTLSYSLSPSVPGLTFNATTRQLTGTPTAAGAHAMTYRVTDDDGDTDSLAFTITVQDAGVSGSPDLVVESASVSDANPEPGASVTFSVTLRNQGDGESAATTLRYYRSTDAMISTADTQVGTDAVGGLPASGTSDETISLTTPSTAGSYYFGACVDPVPGESNAGNNCSSAATVTVAGSDRIAPMDPQSFNRLMIGNRLTAETFFVDFVSDGRFIESGGLPGSYNYASTDLDTGTVTLTYDRGNFGGSCTIQLTFASTRLGSLSFTCESGLASQENWRVAEIGLLPGPGLAPRSGTDMVLDVTLVDRFEARETRAYDVQFRTKSPRGSWRLGCDTFTNNSSSSLTARLSSGIGNLQPGTVYQARYRYRNSSSCSSGSPEEWSGIGEGSTSGEVTLGFSDGESTTRSIPENSPPGINVGIPVAAVSADAVTYSLGGPDAGSFALDSETGQIRTTEGVTYDFEQKNRYLVTVGAQSDSGGSDTIRVTILLGDLVPSCTLLSNVRINSGNTRLTVRWDSAMETGGQVPVLGYETEIRRGDNGAWGQRRTILGRDIGATIYGDLVNGIGYQVRVRPINREGDCGWSIPVSGIPTGAQAPTDAEELIDRFDRQPVGSGDRNWLFLTPERCRHHRNGVTLDANCRYQNTGPDTGRIFLEFDDPSQGSCEISLAYSSLTAGSFIDECFDAGVNTNVPFDRSFRMPPLGPPPEGEIDVPRAPRTTEEFEVLAWGRDDFIPGLFFGCPPVFIECGRTLGSGYRFERDPVTGAPTFTRGDYTYENTGPSQGVLTFQAHDGASHTFTLDFEPSGSMRITITDAGGADSEWPGLVGLGTQPILLPIPPSWSAALAIETDFAPDDWEGLEFGDSTASDDPGEFGGIARALFGGLYRRVFERDYFEGISVTANYEKLGRNRAVVTYRFWDDPEDSDKFDDFGKEVLGSTWTYELRFTAEGTAEYTLTITKDGYLPTVTEGVADFLGDGINFNEFPDELLLPDDPPQASGEDRSGIEIAAAVSTSRIGPYDLQPFLLNNPGAQPIAYSPGDWLEPKDGSNQRMMIVAANPVSAQGAGLFTAAITSFGGRAGRLNQSIANFTITELSVVCMQQVGDIPKRGGRYFSQPKTAQGAVQECQRNCVLDQALSIQGCVWNCEGTGDESASTSAANEGFDDLPLSQVLGALNRQESKGEIFSVPAITGRLSHLSESTEVKIGSRSSFFR